jgi:hypothetical protein
MDFILITKWVVFLLAKFPNKELKHEAGTSK